MPRPCKVVNSAVPPNEFVQIAKEVGPAVVNINTETLPKQSTNRRRNPHSSSIAEPPATAVATTIRTEAAASRSGARRLSELLQSLLRRPGPDQDGGDDGQVRESLGSGFIVDSKGYIITNNHVIEKADKIYVKLSTDPDTQDLGRPARVIGTDKATDLAVIKIDTNSALPTVKLGNSDSTQVGDWVEAIGSPFALSQTVTAGIISAKNRTIEPGASGQFQHFIQTDAAINPGNSGGPLLNMSGEVIGVNTAIFTQSAGYQGIGFAMPSNTVVSVYNDLISPSHKVIRGSIGIQFRPKAFRCGQSRIRIQDRRAGAGGTARRASRQGRPEARRHHHHHRWPPIKDGDDLVNEIASRKPGSTHPSGLPARWQAERHHGHHRRPRQGIRGV